MKTDEPMTYYIRDGVLYVTYDSGENFIEVPDGYEKVCSQSNGTYNELAAIQQLCDHRRVYRIRGGIFASVQHRPGRDLE